MDRLRHTSFFVAPLQISKDKSREASSISETPQVTSSTANSAWGVQKPGQMTPPLTPQDPEASFDRHHDFQTYLRAFYPYHPTYDDSSSTVTLPLNGGDVILVHSVHTNGWADGTLLSSGARGWLPTNYCEGYGSEPISNLMKALTVFWDLVKGSNTRGLAVFRNSDYVRGLVAGVRYLLVSDTSPIFEPCKRLQVANEEVRKTPIASIESQASSSPTMRLGKTEKPFCQTFRPLSELLKDLKASLRMPPVIWMTGLTWTK